MLRSYVFQETRLLVLVVLFETAGRKDATLHVSSCVADEAGVLWITWYSFTVVRRLSASCCDAPSCSFKSSISSFSDVLTSLLAVHIADSAAAITWSVVLGTLGT